MEYRVYLLTFPDGKKYVGMTKHDLKTRMYEGYKHNVRMKNAIAKCGGLKNVTKEVLKDNMTFEEACECEKEYIAKFQTVDPDIGHNISGGGKATFEGLRHTDDRNRKLSQKLKGRVFSESHRINLSKALMGLMVGQKNPNYGKPKSKQTIEKQYESHRHEMKPIIQIDMNGNVVAEFFSMHEAERKTGSRRSSIKRCAEGKQDSSKGYRWKFKEDVQI